VKLNSTKILVTLNCNFANFQKALAGKIVNWALEEEFETR